MKSKKSGNLAQIYLKTYNLVQTLGWTYILLKFLQNDFSSNVETSLWDSVKCPLIIFQHAAFLEAVHAATGIVKSNPMLTTIQILSRVMVVSGVLLATPTSYAASCFGFPLAVLAWSITEIIRYGYYFMNLNEFVPYLLTWLRYTLFIVLYPIGITGELLCIYSGMKYASANPEAFSYILPNSWNFTFSYYYLLAIVALSYIPFFPQLYLHMFAQRRKMLGVDTLKKAK